MDKITDFLEHPEHSQTELAMALSVLKRFKAYESREEWLAIPFAAWSKLEQLEEFLEYLVNGTPLKEDTVRYRAEEA